MDTRPESQCLLEAAHYLTANVQACRAAWVEILKHLSLCNHDKWWAEGMYLLAEHRTGLEEDASGLWAKLIAEPATPPLTRAKATIHLAWSKDDEISTESATDLIAAVQTCIDANEGLARLGLRALAHHWFNKDQQRARSYCVQLIELSEVTCGVISVPAGIAWHELARFEQRCGNIEAALVANQQAMDALPNSPLGQVHKKRFKRIGEEWKLGQRDP
jgi:hypothetical protein